MRREFKRLRLVGARISFHRLFSDTGVAWDPEIFQYVLHTSTVQLRYVR